MSDPVGLDHLPLEEILSALYTAQKCTFFLENMMGQVMDQMGLSDEEAIAVIRLLMEKELISTKFFLPDIFLKPTNIRNFPVVLSSKAIAFLKTNNKK